MSANADDVLEYGLAIGRAARPIAVELQAESTELARVVFEHRACASGSYTQVVYCRS